MINKNNADAEFCTTHLQNIIHTVSVPNIDTESPEEEKKTSNEQKEISALYNKRSGRRIRLPFRVTYEYIQTRLLVARTNTNE